MKKLQKKGFSIIELTLGIAIISMTILFVVCLYSYMMKVSAKGIEISMATSIAESLFDEIPEYRGVSESHPSLVGITSEKYFTGKRTVNGMPYYFAIELIPLKSNLNELELAKIDVAVFWFIENQSQTVVTGEGSEAISTEVGALFNETANQSSAMGASIFSIDEVINRLPNNGMRDNYGNTYRRFERIVIIPD